MLEAAAKRKLPIPKCWMDLTNPVYKGEIMLGNPNSSGTAYLMLATLVQVFGEDEAFKYLAEVHKNVNQYARSGIGPMTAVTRGETALGSTVLHGVINEDVIAEVLAGDGNLESKCRKLIEAARTAGGPDNITTVLLRAK